MSTSAQTNLKEEPDPNEIPLLQSGSFDYENKDHDRIEEVSENGKLGHQESLKKLLDMGLHTKRDWYMYF